MMLIEVEQSDSRHISGGLAMNLVELAKNQLTPEVIGKLSGLVGEGEDKTRVATAAAVPALLSAISGVASSGGGAQKLTSALDGLDLGTLSNFGKAVAGGDAGSLLQMGTGLMGNLFGGGMPSGIVDAVAKFAGLGPGQAKNLIGYLLPLVLGVIGAQRKSQGLNAQGLVSMLADQKQTIANALPAGFSLPNLPGMDAARSASRAVAGSIPAAAPNPMKWLLPLAALGALALLLWWGFGRTRREVPEGPDVVRREAPAPEGRDLVPTVKRVEEPAAPAASAPALDATRTSTDLSGILSSLTGTLTGIRDEATAETALPKLRELDGKLDGIKTVWNALPEAGKTTLTSLVTSHIIKLRELVNKVLAIPGVSDKLKPVTDEILAKLSELAA